MPDDENQAFTEISRHDLLRWKYFRIFRTITRYTLRIPSRLMTVFRGLATRMIRSVYTRRGEGKAGMKSIRPSKLLRAAGMALCALSVTLLAVAAYGLHGVDAVGKAMASLAHAHPTDFNQMEWQQHYRVYWLTWLAAGCSGALVGALMTFRHRSGLVLLIVAVAIPLIYPLAVQWAGWRQYRFEAANDLTVALLLVMLAGAVSAFARYGQRKA